MQNGSITNIQNKISEIENKYKYIYAFDEKKTFEFKKKFQTYKLTCKILFSFPDFYQDVRYIVLNNENSTEKILWDNDHFDMMFEIRSIEPTIKLLYKDGFKLGLITKLEYELLKLIHPRMVNIFKNDVIVKEFYINDIIILPNEKEIEFYFDMLEIILLKITYPINKNRIIIQNIKNILNNDEYIKSINNLKNKLLSLL